MRPELMRLPDNETEVQAWLNAEAVAIEVQLQLADAAESYDPVRAFNIRVDARKRADNWLVISAELG